MTFGSSLFEPRAVRAMSQRQPMEWDEIEVLITSGHPVAGLERLKDEWLFVCSLLGLDWRRARPDDDLVELFRPAWWSLSCSNRLDDLEYELNRITDQSLHEEFPTRLGALVSYLVEHRARR